MKKNLILKLAGFLSRFLPASLKRGLYRLGPFSKMIRHSLNRAAPTGMTEMMISGGALVGMKMALDLQVEKDYWLGTYEIDLQAAIDDWVQPGSVVYDVGANIGYITLLFAKKIGNTGRIFSFEALPQNITRLRTHIALNNLSSMVAIVPGAVTDSSVKVKFLIGPSGAMGKAEGSAGRMAGHQEALEVDGIALDDFVYRDGNPAPQAMKMDIEGGEVLALKGMLRLLDEVKPLIFLELHGHEAARVSWEVLTTAGYTLCRMEKGYPVVSKLDELDWKAYIVARP